MKKLFFVCAALSIFSSCTKDNNENRIVGNDFVTLSADTLSAGPNGGDLELDIESSSAWRMTGGEEEWVTPSAMQGESGASIVFSVKPNDSGECLTNAYKVFTGSAVKKLLIMSHPTYVLDLVSESEYNLSEDGHKLEITLNTNIPNLEYTLSENGGEWINYASKEPVFGKTVFTFNVQQNKGYVDRTSVLTIKGGDNKEIKINISQKAAQVILTEDELYQEFDLSERDFQFTIQTNAEYTVEGISDWIALKDTQKGETVDGLQTQVLTFHLASAVGSKSANIQFMQEGRELLSLKVKQQDPNPVYTNITDEVLKKKLVELEWILVDEEEPTKQEVLEAGKLATSLDVKCEYGTYTKVRSLNGIEAFENLESINVYNNSLSEIDLSKLKKIKELDAKSNYALSVVKLGNNPINYLNLSDALDETYSISISGNNLETIWMNCSRSYDKLQTIDVTGCPKLSTLYVDRPKLTKVLVTQEQLKKVEINKREQTQVVVQ